MTDPKAPDVRVPAADDPLPKEPTEATEPPLEDDPDADVVIPDTQED